jgi:hypothetical protein
MNRMIVAIAAGFLVIALILLFVFGAFGSFKSSATITFTGGTPFGEISRGKPMILECGEGEEGFENLWIDVRSMNPSWLMSGSEAAAEKIVRDTILNDLPDSAKESVKERFSPSVKVAAAATGRKPGFFTNGTEKVTLKGTITAYYGNDESVREFSITLDIKVGGILPGELCAARRSRALAEAFVTMSEVLVLSGDPQGEVESR